MSKPSLSTVVAAKGTATPAVTAERNLATNVPSDEPTKEVNKESSKESSKQVAKEVTKEAAPIRRRPWDNQDELVKANYEVPRRIQTKLHTLKTWGRVKNIKGFVSDALEAALDKEIAKAEREGY